MYCYFREEKGKGDDDCSNEVSPENSNTQRNSFEHKLATENASNTIPLTPCNRICRYNASFYDGKVCIGCFREEYEIEMWQAQTCTQKAMTLLDAIDRCDGIVEEKFDGAITVEELTRQYNHWYNLAKIE